MKHNERGAPSIRVNLNTTQWQSDNRRRRSVYLCKITGAILTHVNYSSTRATRGKPEAEKIQREVYFDWDCFVFDFIIIIFSLSLTTTSTTTAAAAAAKEQNENILLPSLPTIRDTPPHKENSRNDSNSSTAEAVLKIQIIVTLAYLSAAYPHLTFNKFEFVICFKF